MSNPDLTNLSSPLPNLSQLPVAGNVVTQAQQTVTATAETVVTTVQDTVEDSVTAAKELAPVLRMVPDPSSPVELPAPKSGQPDPSPDPAANEPSLGTAGTLPQRVGAPSTGTEGETAEPSGQPPSQPEQEQGPFLGLGNGTQPQGKVPAAVTAFGNAAPTNTKLPQNSTSTLENLALKEQPPVSEENFPEQLTEEQVKFVLARVLTNVSQNAALAGNPPLLAATRKAFENFLSDVGKMVEKGTQEQEKGKYFHDIHGLMGVVLIGLSADPSAKMGRPSSDGAMALAVAAVAKSLKDGSELMALLMGAMMLANTVPYAAANETLQDQKVDQGQLTLEFAKKYAERVIKLTSDPAYSGYLKELVMLHNSDTHSPQRIDQWVSVLKVGLLLTAVALLYQVETGGGTAEEVIGCLRPGREVKENDLKTPLLKQIKGHLETLPANDREAVILSMMEYLDSKPDLKSITDPIKVMQGMQSTGAFVPGQIQLASGA